MKIALITDTHWGARGNSQTFLKYFEKFYGEFFFPLLKERGITKVIHLGDIFENRTSINYSVLNKFRECFLNPCIEAGIELHAIIGNHDTLYKNTNSVNSMEQLFGFFHNTLNSSKVFFYSDPAEIVIDGVSLAISPWINNENYGDSMKFLADTKAQLLFGHFEFNGFEMQRGMYNEHGMNTSGFSRFDMVFSGHFHHKSSRDNIHYLGAPYEMTWHDYDDPRGVHILDLSTRKLEYIENPLHMFFKFFYDDTLQTKTELESYEFSEYSNAYVKVVVSNKTNPYLFDLTLDRIYKANPANVSIVDDNKRIDQVSDELTINQVDDAPTTISKYVKATASSSVDEKELIKYLTDKYHEAVQLETNE